MSFHVVSLFCMENVVVSVCEYTHDLFSCSARISASNVALFQTILYSIYRCFN